MSLQSTDNFERDNLYAGGVQPISSKSVTIASGQGVLVRGTVLGKLDADNKCVIVDSTGGGGEDPDGSQDVYAVLTETVDATNSDVVAPADITGDFNERALVFGGTDTADDHRDSAKKIGIFFRDTVAK